MPPRYARLAGLGAFGACVGMVALFAGLIYLSRHTPTGGMPVSLSWLTWISLAVVFVALIVVHVAIGRQLLSIGRGGGPTQD
jgi:hypothetical protein